MGRRALKDMPIGKRMLVTFGVILALFLVTVVLAALSLLSTGSNFTSFYNGAYEVTNKSSDLRGDIQTFAKYVGYSMMTSDEKQTAEYVQAAQDKIQDLRDGTAYMRENFKGDISIIDTYDSIMKGVMDDRDQVLAYALSNENEKAIELYFSKVMPAFVQANECLVQIDESASQSADDTYSFANTQKNVITVILLLLSVITFVATVMMARYLVNSITKPIDEIEKAAKEMAQGSLKAQIAYESEDEMGSLADSMREVMHKTSDIVEDIRVILGNLAEGNFRITSKCIDNYKGDYVPIVDAMRLIRDNLNTTLLEINESTQQVAAGAVQMAENAQGLAEGATEQAGAVEELTATVEAVANMAERSTEQAKQASAQVNESAEKAENSKQDMAELIKAMDRISSTSKEIENIIAEIEDIASQTNLLALNASIEAARAGEAGRGFAVVADQIGKLASDSAQSAVNTKELISKTLDEINVGNKITQKTSQAFEEVIDEMKQFAIVSEESSRTSMDQYESLKQVANGIDQISNVVQSNSAASEETSATSEELSAQADSLESQVRKFQLIEA